MPVPRTIWLYLWALEDYAHFIGPKFRIRAVVYRPYPTASFFHNRIVSFLCQMDG